MKLKVSFLDEDSLRLRIRSFEDDFFSESYLLWDKLSKDNSDDDIKEYISDVYSIPTEVFDAYAIMRDEEFIHVHPRIWYEE